MLHEEVDQRARDGGRRVEEEGGDPEDGAVQPLQAQEEVVAVLHGEQVVVVLLQDAGVERGHVGVPAHVLLENLGGCEVAAEHVVELLDLRAALGAREDAAVAHHSAHVVMLVEDGRGLGQQRVEVLPDGEHVLVAGVVVVHELAHAHPAANQGEVVGDVDVAGDVLPARQRHTAWHGLGSDALWRTASSGCTAVTLVWDRSQDYTFIHCTPTYEEKRIVGCFKC